MLSELQFVAIIMQMNSERRTHPLSVVTGIPTVVRITKQIPGDSQHG